MHGPIPDPLMDTAVMGVHLAPGTLRDQLGAGATLMVFLRHFGCIFCRETVAELRTAAEARPDYPPVLFFFQGTPTEGRVFLSRIWPQARAVSDPAKRFYAAFGVERGGPLAMFGPGVWRGRARARAKGHQQGRVQGDAFMMPGAFWVEDGRIRWRYAYRHAGDQPDFAAIPDLVAAGPA